MNLKEVASKIESSAIISEEDSNAFIIQGDEYLKEKRYNLAESEYKKAIISYADNAMAYYSLGIVNRSKNYDDLAIINFDKALQINPKLGVANRAMALVFVSKNLLHESIKYWSRVLEEGEVGLSWINKTISAALREKDLTLAGNYAKILATLRWGSKCYPSNKSLDYSIPERPPVTVLTIPKLQHDIEQIQYLQQKNILNKDFNSVVNNYERIIDHLKEKNVGSHVPMDDFSQNIIGEYYNRILYTRDTPRVKKALSSLWDTNKVQEEFLKNKSGLAVIDNFLTKEALENLLSFCRESTVWSGNRYANGRLGAFFNDGFNCPLLHQISEELRESLPRIIAKEYPLRQIWGFKNGQYLPADSTIHADFASVNVNIWITPEEANMDPQSGGLVVYNIDAPLNWDFSTYNGRIDIIKSFLKEQRATATHIPYKQNRALIFNSDLFHSTAGIKFKPGYENRRINVTFLYGDRENDTHHRNLANYPDAKQSSGSTNAWRSSVFTSIRKRNSY